MASSQSSTPPERALSRSSSSIASHTTSVSNRSRSSSSSRSSRSSRNSRSRRSNTSSYSGRSNLFSTSTGASLKQLTCGKCGEVYRSPKLLPCTDSFCLPCLEELVAQATEAADNSGEENGTVCFPCPECTAIIAVPPGGAEHFKDNRWIGKDELQRARGGLGVETLSVACPSHPGWKLEFFCRGCEDAVCFKCFLTKHNNDGGVEDLAEAAQRCRDQLAMLQEKLRERATRRQRAAHLAQSGVQAARLKAETLETQINAQHDWLVRTFTELRDKVLEELGLHMNQRIRDLQALASDADNDIVILEQLQQRAQHVLERDDNDAVETVSTTKSIKRALELIDEEERRAQGETRRLQPRQEERSDISTLRRSLSESLDRVRRFLDSAVTLAHNLGALRLVLPASPVLVYRCGEQLGDGEEEQVGDRGGEHEDREGEQDEREQERNREGEQEVNREREREGNRQEQEGNREREREGNRQEQDGNREREGEGNREGEQQGNREREQEGLQSGCLQVHALHRTDSGQLNVAYGGRPPRYEQGKLAVLSFSGVYEGALGLESAQVFHLGTKISFDKSHTGPDSSFAPHFDPNSSGESQILHACSSANFLLKTTVSNNRSGETCMRTVIESRPTTTESSPTKTFSFEISAASKPLAFDANHKGNLFVVVNEEKPQPRPPLAGATPRGPPDTTNALKLYRKGDRDPVDMYASPKDQGCHPTAVTFWRRGRGHGQELLLVADGVGDAVHIVHVAPGGQFHYLCDLTPGLVYPTALDVDHLGNIWVGCRDGAVFECRLPGAGGGEDDGDGEGEGELSLNVLNISSDSLLESRFFFTGVSFGHTFQ